VLAGLATRGLGILQAAIGVEKFGLSLDSIPVLLLSHPKKPFGQSMCTVSLPAAMPDVLTAEDYAVLSAHQHERLRSHYPAELQDAVLLTRHDETLVIACDWETIALLNDNWDCFADFAYTTTGCGSTTFYVDGVAVLTQTRPRLSDSRTPTIQLQQNMKKDKTMVATAERRRTAKVTPQQAAAIETMQAAAAAVIAATPTRSIADVVRELTDLIANQAIAKVEARSLTLNPITASLSSTPGFDVEPILEAVETMPTKLPTVRLKGIFTPTKSNWTQAARRYLKAVDPTGDAAKALKEIVSRSPSGLAHLERAIREYPPADQEQARTRLYQGFMKVADSRNEQSETTAS